MKATTLFMTLFHWSSFLLTVVFLSACTSMPGSKSQPPESDNHAIESRSIVEPILPEVNVSVIEPVEPEQYADLPDEITQQETLWARLENGFDFPPIPQSNYQVHLSKFLSRPQLLANQIEAALPYLAFVLEQVEERGLPTELALLPYIESGYQLDARAHSGAAGAWQIMPATARSLKIELSWWNDGRLNLYTSTLAALDYLEYLYQKYQDWNLVLIAYNAGPARLNRALRNGPSNDFTRLALPTESLQYVPKLYAYREAVIHLNQPDSAIRIPANPMQLQPVIIDRQIDLKVVASLADLSLEQILELNPGYRRWATGVNGEHEFLLPTDNAEQLELKIATLKPDQFMPWTYYTIRPGDTLGELAHQFKIPVNELKRLNNLQKSRIIAGRKLKVPNSSDNPVTPFPSKDQLHTVTPGDSLWKIARRYGLSVKTLTLLNDRSKHQPLFPGEQLRVTR